VPTKVAEGVVDGNLIGSLSISFHSGEWEVLLEAIRTSLGNSSLTSVDSSSNTICYETTDNNRGFDFKNNYYLVVFLTTHDVLASVLAHDPIPEPYTTVLPGLKPESKNLCEVFIYDVPDAAFKSGYEFTRAENPLITQLPDFLKMVLPSQPDPEVKDKKTGVIVSYIPVPYARASIKVTHWYSASPRPKPAGTDQAGSVEATPTDSIKKKEVEVTSEYSNSPKTMLSLGLLGGVTFARNGDERVAVEEGVLVADPFDRGILMGVLNIHLGRYQAESQTISRVERYRFFVGVPFVPSVGLAIGAGVLLVRGLSFDVGATGFLVKTLQGGDSLGGSPSNPDDPTSTGLQWAFFVGAAYNFDR
jgi:hypothetical protein